MNFLIKVALVALLLVANSTWAQLTPEQQAAKEKGLMFYQQHKGISAIPLLRSAAEAGDSEAQYFLAETLRLNAMHITAESQKWYEAAAEQGEVYAMLRLGNKGNDLCVVMSSCSPDHKKPVEWLIMARDTATARAAKGDAEAMKQLEHITGEFEWLEKSAAAGFGEGQYWLAIAYRQDEGWFFWPGSREEAVEKWFKASAESGYPPGMMSYVDIRGKRGDMASVRHWIEKAAEAGYIDAVGSYAAYSAHTPDEVGYPLDLVKGYGLMLLLSELDGGGGMQIYTEEKLPEIARKMSPAQIDQAKVFAEKWRKTHPPLSFFVNKYGF